MEAIRVRACPHCDSSLRGTTRSQDTRGDAGPGGKTTSAELVTCPDCDRLIDGFAAH